ncbi:MAG: terminase family protein, partial [Pseudomonadota bacterium]
SRQIGKTFCTCAEAVDDCIKAEMEGRRARWVILSRGERQAAEAIREGIALLTRGFFAAYNIHRQAGLPAGMTIGEIEEPSVQRFDAQDAEYKRLEVTFPGGSRITAIPANPDTARGFSANVMLDEFAFHRDSRAIWKALFPVISNGWKIRVISTPNGKNNRFFELMTSEDTDWSRHVVDIHHAAADGLPRDVEALRRGIADDDAWAQEFELQWLDEASSWLSYDLINGVEHVAAGDPGGYQGGPCFVGVDIAARQDLFVIWVVEAMGDVLWTREIIARTRITFAEQDHLLDDVVNRYRVVRIAMDQTGMGEKPVEDAQRRHGASRVEGVMFTGPRKLDLATVLKERFEDRTLRIPAGDASLRADLHSVRKETGATGHPRLIADRDAGSHADRFWAGALAVGAAASPHQPYDYRAVRPGRDRNARGFEAGGGFGRGGGLH